MNISIDRVKKAAKRILLQNYHRCVIATCVTGFLITFIFDYFLDGTMKLNSAFDFTVLGEKLAEFTTYEEVINYFQTSINSYIEAVGYEAYAFMMRKLLLAVLLSFIMRQLYVMLVVNPLGVGSCGFYLDAHSITPTFKRLIFAFKSNYINVVLITFARSVYVFLWSLLLFIPGMIKSYETFMIPYLLADNPDMDIKEAFSLSKKMMYGNKLDVFLLNLSFIGWLFLSVLSSGIIYVFFVGPYISAAQANIAQRIKARYNYEQISDIEENKLCL